MSLCYSKIVVYSSVRSQIVRDQLVYGPDANKSKPMGSDSTRPRAEKKFALSLSQRVAMRWKSLSLPKALDDITPLVSLATMPDTLFWANIRHLTDSRRLCYLAHVYRSIPL
jgi:hypothetical protein